MSENSSKKRLIITISSLCIAIVAVICSVVAIFAAAQQGVQSTFKVSYKATNVAATVSAKYTVKNSDAVDLGTANITAAADKTTYTNLSTDAEITLTAANNEVVFQYSFKNNSASNKIKVTLEDNAAKENVTVQYATAATADSSSLTYSSSLSADGVEVASSSTVYIYIKVTIADDANSASYVADTTNTLTWNLEAVTAD